jgi:hypothetical protein
VHVEFLFFESLFFPKGEFIVKTSPTYCIINEPLGIGSPAAKPHPFCSVLNG